MGYQTLFQELSHGATHSQNSTVLPASVLYLSLELGWKTWKLAFAIGRVAGDKSLD
jgi:hypothetical protein